MKYVSRPNSPRAEWWDDGCPLILSLNVDGGKEVDTGLIDRHGNVIMRLQNPIGFGRG